MTISFFQVDAFTDRLFSGNPAGVCPLVQWLPDSLMQQIATENNLSETAFFIKTDEGYHIRWFTPAVEVDLCGHATLSAAHVLFRHLGHSEPEISFRSKSGTLRVRKDDELIILDFPADELRDANPPAGLISALGAVPLECQRGKTDYMLVYQAEEDILSIKPDFALLKALPVRGIIVTAPGKEVDFVSRFFAPAVGVDEDPVTGSAHTSLIPYWSKRLGKQTMQAVQLSMRKGALQCSTSGDRVNIGGKAVTYLSGEISI